MSIPNCKNGSFVYESKTQWQPAGEGVLRQIMSYNEDMMLVKVKFQEGAVGTEHSHPHTQISYVQSGRFEYSIEGENKVIEHGDTVCVGPNLKHGCRCLEAGVLIDCFSPARQDFLK